jgi:hypothetical protein
MGYQLHWQRDHSAVPELDQQCVLLRAVHDGAGARLHFRRTLPGAGRANAFVGEMILNVDTEAALPAARQAIADARQALVAALRAVPGYRAVAANLWDGALIGMAVMREHLSGSLGVACSLISS